MLDPRGRVPWRFFFRPNALELWTGILVAFLTVIGLAWSHADKKSFKKIYVMEDGPIEWLTVGLLLGLAFICLRRFARLRGCKPKVFLCSLLGGAVVFFFGAGEEIAWGQRVFGFGTPEAVQQFNTQNEFTVHNLEFGQVRLNKLVFGLLLTIFVVAYIFVLPVVWQFWAPVRDWVDHLALPVPRGYHALMIVLLAPLVAFIPSSNRWEILELIVVSAVFLAFLYPLNRSAFQAGEGRRGP